MNPKLSPYATPIDRDRMYAANARDRIRETSSELRRLERASEVRPLTASERGRMHCLRNLVADSINR